MPPRKKEQSWKKLEALVNEDQEEKAIMNRLRNASLDDHEGLDWFEEEDLGKAMDKELTLTKDFDVYEEVKKEALTK